MVKKMLDTSFDDAVNKANFMFNVKERVQEVRKKFLPKLSKAVAEQNYQDFIEALEELGIVKIFHCPECVHYINNKCEKGLATSPFLKDCVSMEIKVNPAEVI